MCAELLNVALSHGKKIAGRVEAVTIMPEGLELQGKLDTGADHSSLNGEHIARLQREGATWARFDVTNHVGKRATFERKVLRVSRIKLRTGGYQARPVVMLRICLGSRSSAAGVNLVDRSGFRCPLLIERRYLQGRIVVDHALQFAQTPECRGATEQ